MWGQDRPILSCLLDNNRVKANIILNERYENLIRPFALPLLIFFKELKLSSDIIAVWLNSLLLLASLGHYKGLFIEDFTLFSLVMLMGLQVESLCGIFQKKYMNQRIPCVRWTFLCGFPLLIFYIFQCC